MQKPSGCGLAGALALALSLSGCSQPAVAPKPFAFQDSALTVRDWDTVAQRIASGLAERGFVPNLPPPGQVAVPTAMHPIYVQILAPGSTFLHEVREALQSEILKRGGLLARTPEGVIVVNLDVDVVKWGAREQAPGGLATALGLAAGTGILLANAAPLSPAAGFGIAAGAGLATDALQSIVPNTNAEAVWEASIISDTQILLDVRAPIYITASDVLLYHSGTRLGPIQSLRPASISYPRQLHYAP